MEGAGHKSDVSKVVMQGICVGCGACAIGNAHEPGVMSFDQYGLYKPDLSVLSDLNKADLVCPFSNKASNEDELSAMRFSEACENKNDKIGFYYKTYAGHVSSGEFRSKGSSGGMGTWLATKLVQSGIADAVIHVKKSNDGEKLFKYAISFSEDEIRIGGKSKYYPITLEEVIEFVRSKDKRYVFIGIPCFVKAVRLLSIQFPEVNSRIVACIGLVCGHLKSRAFAESLAWQVGIKPASLMAFDFRKKLPDSTADAYGIEAVGSSIHGSELTKAASMKSLFGHDWGWGVFKPKSCDYCDDVVAEAADITIGDAWLPKYVKDHQGTNIIIVRNKLFDKLLSDAAANGEIFIEPLTVDEVIQTQSSGFSHRRQGLAYRLFSDLKRNEWVPKKRVVPLNSVNECGSKFAARQDLRIKIRDQSHELFLKAKQQNDIEVYIKGLVPDIESYRNITRGRLKSLVARIRFMLFGFKL
jgi:coenzyme F420 hydrogenase subunit beta